MKRITSIMITAAVLLLGLAAPSHALDPGEENPDTTPPTITVIRPAGHFEGWYNGAVDISISVTESGAGSSGVAQVYLTMEGATVMPRTSITRSHTQRISAVGSTKLTFEAYDREDNHAMQVHWVGVDVDAPVISAQGLVDGAILAQHSSVPITFSCWDAHSGIRTCLADGTAGPITSGSDLSTARLGVNTLRLSTSDNVGNTRIQTLTYQVLPATLRVVQRPTHANSARVGDTLISTVPQFEPYPDHVAYQWLRNGEAIDDAQGSAYRLSPDDHGAAISVRTTGTRAGFGNGVATSEPVTVAPGPAPTGVSVTVIGNAVVGGMLAAAPTGVPHNAEVTYQWLRDDEPISGATSRNYGLQPADAGRLVTVRLTAEVAGYSPAIATSSAVRIAARPDPGKNPGDPNPPGKPDRPNKPSDNPKKAKAKVTVKAKKIVKRGQKVKVTVRIKTKAASPAGRVTIRLGKSRAKTVRVNAKGVATAKLKVSKRGKAKIRVRYLGSATVQPSKAARSIQVR